VHTRKLSIQLYLEHVAEKHKKEETKTNKRQWPFKSVRKRTYWKVHQWRI